MIEPRLKGTPSTLTSTLWSKPASLDEELMPRIEIMEPVPDPPSPMETCGASSPILVRSVTRLFCNWAEPIAVTATGTLCSVSSRLRAVTMISLPLELSAAGALSALSADLAKATPPCNAMAVPHSNDAKYLFMPHPP